MTQEKTNRNYKDSVFVDLFAHDITAKENFISLYNADFLCRFSDKKIEKKNRLHEW